MFKISLTSASLSFKPSSNTNFIYHDSTFAHHFTTIALIYLCQPELSFEQSSKSPKAEDISQPREGPLKRLMRVDRIHQRQQTFKHLGQIFQNKRNCREKLTSADSQSFSFDSVCNSFTCTISVLSSRVLISE
jgi:hypothetical protein